MQEVKDLVTNFLNPENVQISIVEFLLHIFLTACLAVALGFFYVRYGHSLSNRKALAGTLVLIAVTTMIIITIVKSSLALSLGLVGALSIVRFRTAIKDPEELSYFFIAIAIGLGMGAGQPLITILGSFFLFGVVFYRKFTGKDEIIQNLLLTIQKPHGDFDFENVIKTVGSFSTQLELRRLEETEQSTEISLFVRFSNFDNLVASKKALTAIDGRIQFSYLENI